MQPGNFPGQNNYMMNFYAHPPPMGMPMHNPGRPQYFGVAGAGLLGVAPPGMMRPRPMNPQPPMGAVEPVVTKETFTVYVGSIAPEIPDDIIKELLMECGRVVKWLRTVEPTSQQLLPFGFCEFEDIQGVARATAHLHNAALVSGKAIVVTCQEKVRDLLSRWRTERTAVVASQNPSLTLQDVKKKISNDDVNFKRTFHKLLNEAKLRMEREVQQSGATAAQRTAQTEEKESATGGDTSAEASEEKSTSNNDGAETPKSKLEGPPPSRNSVMKSNFSPALTSGPVKWLSVDYRPSYREREREKRHANRERDREREYKRREKEWVREEEAVAKERKRWRGKEQERLSVPDSIKRKLIRLDMHGEFWDGPPTKRERQERRAAREEERLADEEAAEEDGTTDATDSKQVEDEEEEGEIGNLPGAASRALNCDVPLSTPIDHIEGCDDISNPVHLSGHDDVPAESTSLMMGGTVGTAFTVGADKNTAVSSQSTSQSTTSGMTVNVVLKAKPKLEVTKSRFSGDVSVLGGSNGTNGVSVFECDETLNSSHEDEKTRQRRLDRIAKLVPSSKEEVFAFPVDYELLIKHNVFESKLRSWIGKRVADVLGVEETGLVDYILEKLSQKPSAEELLTELDELIDCEAPNFVLRLWRLIIFEQLRIGQTVG